MTMTSADLLPAAVLKRKAVVYVRQSTQAQVHSNLEGQRRQYELVDVARRRGFREVEVIDDDLGRSASGMVARPGFERLVAWLCAGEVGAVLCFDASRLARNGRDWHHLLELCGLVEARVIDLDGVYDPCRPNDRLLLGMKGSISEFELGVLRARMLDAARAKARRGELRIGVPIGYIWHREVGLGLDPDRRIQEGIRLIFSRFRELGSARQVLLSMTKDQVHFPRPSDGKKLVAFEWLPIRYRNVISVLKNPFYAGAYAYGKSEQRTAIVDGRLRKTFGGPRIDAAIAEKILRAIEPMAIEAALQAEQRQMENQGERQRIAELELQQARYEASLAERRYAACDPDNRLIAAQLEKSWEAALRRVETCQARLEAVRTPEPAIVTPDFTGLADDLDAAWNAPGVTMRTRQRLLRALVTDIIADVDEATREVVLTIHWRGGQHSQLRVRKPKSGEHGCRTPEEALAVMRSMATRWSDEDIAASLNRMGMPTGQGKTWTAHRVSSLRRVHGIRAYRSAESNGEWLTLSEAAAKLGVSHHQVRKLIKAGILNSEQIMPDAPHQIRSADLASEQVVAALKQKGRPCRVDSERQISMFTNA